MSKIINFKNYIDEQITLDDFFHMYYNFEKGTFYGLTHKEVENNFTFVNRADNITRESILRGETLLVKDRKGEVLAYQNPFAAKDNEEVDQYLNECKDNNKVCVIFTVSDDIDVINEEDIENMSRYELSKERKKLVDNHEYRMARLVQKELYFRHKNESGTKKQKIRELEKKERREEDE